ncbi:DinB family protein [Paenibacillus hamazuiensis]|uniref:DinB family protein n=1 Tax=Paenibacillus hamazuiensis TaxID=2936508 RepID=UPI00200C9062|nr:DinB family protein [Paenibacillus hamazuiensis]
MSILTRQYEWIRQTREVLFHYCETLSTSDYVKDHESFGGASMRSLHAHAADCYLFWLGSFALKRTIAPIPAEQFSNVQAMRKVFAGIDLLVGDFLNEFEDQPDLKIPGTPSWQEETIMLTPLWLFTHTTTHEFHHKGQILSMSRQLGYIPMVTDLYHPTRTNG